MHFTYTVTTLLLSATAIQASCVPILTCGMRRRDLHLVAARTTPPSSDDFSDAFALCLNKEKLNVKPLGATAFVVKNAKACIPMAKIYQKSGMKDGRLELKGNDIEFTPTKEDYPEWKVAVSQHLAARRIAAREALAEVEEEGEEEA
jgi:hypothetical protein